MIIFSDELDDLEAEVEVIRLDDAGQTGLEESVYV